PRDGPAGSWTADVTSSAPSGRRPLSHRTLGMRWHRSARLGRSWALLAGRTRSSRHSLSASGVCGRLGRALRAALAAPLGPEQRGKHHVTIWTRLQDGQGLAAVPDRLIRDNVTAFGRDAFGVADRLPGVIARRLSGLLMPPLSDVAGVVQRQVGLHGSGSSSITVSCRKPGFGCPYSWVEIGRA